MKTLTQLKTFLLLGTTITLIASCSSNIMDNTNTEDMSSAKISDYNYLGDIHNLFMSNIQEHLTTDQKIESVDEGIDYILDFNTRLVAKIDIDKYGIDKRDFIKGLSYYKNLVNAVHFENALVEQNDTRANLSNKSVLTLNDFETLANDSVLDVSDLPNVKSLVNFVKDNDLITTETYNYLQELLSLIDKSVAGLISDEKFEQELDQMIAKIDNAKYQKECPTINTVGPVFALSKSSLQWWEENPQAIPVEGKIPHVVAMDAAGAIV